MNFIPFKIPFAYTWRSLWTRRITTLLTLGGISLVVFVFAAVLMLANGLEDTLVETGSDDNVIVLRRAANSELVSQIGRDAASIIKTHPEIATLPNGKPIASTEVYVVINLSKKESGDMGNISVRGISPEAFALRPAVQLTAGRMFQFGTDEIIVGSNVADKFEGCGIGQRIRFGDAYWTIVGHFEAGGRAFESEIWGDVEQLMPAFGRPVFSTITFRLKDPADFETVKKKIETDPRTQYTQVKLERQYYLEQTQLMSDFIKLLGLVVTVIFSIGAIIGAMITMFAAVANRTVEIGTLRALGFRRRNVLAAFFLEAMLLSCIGGVAGIVLASIMSFVRISTVHWGTFSELGFGFELSVSIAITCMIFALIMGFIGGFLPAVRAARLQITTALRAS
jgi:ABC-type lipoprotein release transport system permease subunit